MILTLQRMFKGMYSDGIFNCPRNKIAGIDSSNHSASEVSAIFPPIQRGMGSNGTIITYNYYQSIIFLIVKWNLFSGNVLTDISGGLQFSYYHDCQVIIP